MGLIRDFKEVNLLVLVRFRKDVGFLFVEFEKEFVYRAFVIVPEQAAFLIGYPFTGQG